MLVQLAFAFALTCVNVLVHAVGTVEAIAHLARVWQKKGRSPGHLAESIQIVRIISVLLVMHLIEASVWAAFYVISGALPDVETAIYFSITSYTTVGYGDVVLPMPWRLLGPIEGAVGILMFGWSTAIMVTALTRIYSSRMQTTAENEHDGAGSPE